MWWCQVPIGKEEGRRDLKNGERKVQVIRIPTARMIALWKVSPEKRAPKFGEDISRAGLTIY